MSVKNIEDFKIGEFQNPITDLSDRPSIKDNLTSEQMKARFDALPNEVKVAVNLLIDFLRGQGETGVQTSGADGIGVAPITDINAPGITPETPAATVQEALEGLKNFAMALAFPEVVADMSKAEFVNADGTGKVLAAANADKLGGALPAAFAKIGEDQDVTFHNISVNNVTVRPGGKLVGAVYQ